MTSHGKIVALLNQDQLIVQILDEYVEITNPGDKLTVFSLAVSNALSNLGLPPVYAPKGEVKIVMHQSEGYFLAERFREGGHVERRPIAALDFFTQEVRVGATWSAEINPIDTLGVDFDKELKTSDIVGEI